MVNYGKLLAKRRSPDEKVQEFHLWIKGVYGNLRGFVRENAKPDRSSGFVALKTA